MTVIHIVTFQPSTPILIPSLIADYSSTLLSSIKPNGKKYISSVKSGKELYLHQSIAGQAGYNVPKVVFVLEFKDKEDLSYFINEDPVHILFKTRCETELGVRDVHVTSFEDGVYVEHRKLNLSVN